MRGPPFDVVFFDCDSTLSAVEGIDELARRAGVYDTVAPLTRLAMEGSLTLDEVYKKRLDLIRPDRAALAWLGAQYVEKVVPDARDTLAALTRLGKHVHIMSGGLHEAVVTLGDYLGVPREQVHAVPVRLSPTGDYVGFAEDAPLARSRGKAEQCRRLLKGARAALVGDGVTDLEAAAAGVFVVGFGGVIRREKLVERADAYCAGPALACVLEFLLTPAELGRYRSSVAESN
jgi:phosphoserine phosphatase